MLFAPLLLSAATIVAHPGSFSRSMVSIHGSELQHSMRVQALTLIETLPIDANEDLILDEAELAGAQEEISWYLSQHYRFFANGREDKALRGELTGFQLMLDGSPQLPTNYWLHVDFEYSGPREIRTVTIDESLFETSNPQHLEYVSVAWDDQEPSHHVFSGDERTLTFEPTGRKRRGLLSTFFEMGVEHILSGWDHLLFLIALLVGVRSARSLALVVTAFTLAHSVTLALAALDLVSLPSSFVEIAIALSIVYVAAENLMKLGKRSLWVEALVFGLLHGLGFAGFLSDALRREDELLLPLVGFNLGVEAGQLLVVIPLAIVFHFVAKRRPATSELGEDVEVPSEIRLVPIPLGRLVSVAVICVGLFWFAERAGFIG